MRRRKDCRRKRCVWQTKCGHDGGYGGDDYGHGYNCKKVKVISSLLQFLYPKHRAGIMIL